MPGIIKKLLDHKAYNCMRNITHVRSGDNKLGRLLMGMKRETRNVSKLKWSGQRSDHGISCACTHITMQEVDTHITMQEVDTSENHEVGHKSVTSSALEIISPSNPIFRVTHE